MKVIVAPAEAGGEVPFWASEQGAREAERESSLSYKTCNVCQGARYACHRHGVLCSDMA